MHRAQDSRGRSHTEVEVKRRIVVCDYSGHPFQVQLSRELARRGHYVRHLYSRDFLTPHGQLSWQNGDAPSLEIQGLSIGEVHAKDSLIRRRRQEKRFGSLAAERALASEPDVVLSCNMPLDAQAELSSACRRHGVGFGFWLQDIYSIAISRILTRKFGLVGQLIGWRYQVLEKTMLKKSDFVVCISGDFIDIITKWGVDRARCLAIPNWGPLSEIHIEKRINDWRKTYNVHDQKVILYSGTLGLKHNVNMMVEAAMSLKDRNDVVFIVISEGFQADQLRVLAAKNGLHNLMVLPFQPYEQYSKVLGAADILVAFIDGDAGVYSVPSKVLSYLCSGRPIVLAAPGENLACRTVIEAQAGVVVPADAPTAFVRSIADLVDDDARRAELGLNARRYAERQFDIGPITDRFEAALAAAARPWKARSTSWIRRPPGVWSIAVGRN